MEGWGQDNVRNGIQAPTCLIYQTSEVPPTGVGLITACHPGNAGRLLASGEGPWVKVPHGTLPQNVDVHNGTYNEGISYQTREFIDPIPDLDVTG